MPECNYCEESFEREDNYLDHLEAEHLEELGRIDRRRLGLQDDSEEDGRGTGPMILGGLVVVAVAVVVFTLVSSSGGAGEITPGQEPTNLGSVHYHGTMAVTIGGERIDFGQREYQMQADPFHFEGGGDTQWHVHAQGVTLKYALGTLGFNVTESTVTHEGTTYRDSDPNTTVTVTVNGESVTPREYGLQGGDTVRIVAERS